MKITIFIDDKLQLEYKSNLFVLFSQKVTSHFFVTASLKEYHTGIFPVFTACSEYIARFIKERKIDDYGVILDANDLANNETNMQIILKAKFAFLIGENSNSYDNFKNVRRIGYLHDVKKRIDCNTSILLSELDTLDRAYECLLEDSYAEFSVIHILCSSWAFKKDKLEYLHFLRNKFTALNKNLILHCPTNAEYNFLLSYTKKVLGSPSLKLQYDLGMVSLQDSDIMSVADFCNLLESTIKQIKSNIEVNTKKINIICYNPTYLFKDLVDRFVDKGCVYSDFPLPDAGAYIWMRPQEIWHLDYLNKRIPHNEISNAYSHAFSKQSSKSLDMKYVRFRSVAIHHGTCYEPIYQFCPDRLAKALRTVSSVIGVCEFEECYGPSAQFALKDNFECVPIGFDSTLFTSSSVKQEQREPNERLKIGFVGRAYGTLNKELLNKSRLAEPKGYRKGGDILLEIAINLKNIGIDFELHIIGTGWEELVEQLDANNIYVKYYARDSQITYKEYPTIYSLMDVLLITSRCEGGPVSALEGLSLGLKVVSSDVGIVKYLDAQLKGTDNVFIFEYDRKWSTFDLNTAINHFKYISKLPITYKDRLQTRMLVEEHTTEHWVRYIFDKAAKLAKDVLSVKVEI